MNSKERSADKYLYVFIYQYDISSVHIILYDYKHIAIKRCVIVRLLLVLT